MKRLVAGILAASLLSSAAGAASHDPEHTGGIHSSVTTQQTQSMVIAASSTAHPATMTVLLDGTQVKPVGYNINGNNYYKLRDIAQVLTNSTAQFSVAWDKSTRTMNLTPGFSYAEMTLSDTLISCISAVQSTTPRTPSSCTSKFDPLPMT